MAQIFGNTHQHLEHDVVEGENADVRICNFDDLAGRAMSSFLELVQIPLDVFKRVAFPRMILSQQFEMIGKRCSTFDSLVGPLS